MDRKLPALACGFVFLFCSVRLLIYTHENATNVMFWDQWDFYAPLFSRQGLLASFRQQHGPHRQGLGGVLIASISEYSAWDGTALAYAGTFLLIISAGLALWLKAKLSQNLTVLDAWIPWLIMHPRHYETLTLVPNIAHSTLPFMLTMCAALALSIRRQHLQAICLLITATFLVFTGFGIFAGVVVLGLIALNLLRSNTRSLRLIWGVASLGAPIILYSFLRDWIPQTAAGCPVFPHPVWRDYGIFAGAQLSNGAGLIASQLGSPAFWIAITFGWLLGAAGALVAIKSIATPGLEAIALLIISALLFVASTTFGRVCIDPYAQGFASRYALLVVPLLLGLIIWFSRWKPRLAAPASALPIALIAATLLPAFDQFAPTATAMNMRDQKLAWATCMRESRNPELCDTRTNFRLYPNTESIASRLRFLERNSLNMFAALPRAGLITTPGENSAVSTDQILISGSVDATNFKQYDVEWGAGFFPTEWIWLSGPHLAEVQADLLTTWDASRLPAGRYTVRMTVHKTDGSKAATYSSFVKP